MDSVKIKGKEYVLNTDLTMLQRKEICELCEIKYYGNKMGVITRIKASRKYIEMKANAEEEVNVEGDIVEEDNNNEEDDDENDEEEEEESNNHENNNEEEEDENDEEEEEESNNNDNLEKEGQNNDDKSSDSEGIYIYIIIIILKAIIMLCFRC
jgi:hypothetical protein